MSFYNKIFAASTAALLTLSLSACSESSADRVKLGQDYSCSVEITAADSKYQADLSTAGGVWTVTYSYPEEISGMCVTFEGENCRIEYMGMEMNSDRELVPPASLSGLITKTLDSISYDPNVKFTKTKNGVKASGVVEGADFTVDFNKKELPVNISLGDGSFTAKISDHKKL